MTALRDLELDVLTDYAAGRNLTDIAKDAGVHLDRVTGILTRRVGMDRDKARALVEQVGASPLTATIPAKTTVGKDKQRAAGRLPAKDADDIDDSVNGRGIGGEVARIQAGLAEPIYPDPLDVGLGEVSGKLRDLVVGLAQDIAARQRATDLRAREARLEEELRAVRAELDAGEKVGGGV